MKNKKILAVFLTVIAVFSLAACGAKSEPKEQAEMRYDYGNADAVLYSDSGIASLSEKPGDYYKEDSGLKYDGSQSTASAKDNASYLPSDVKLIYRAYVNLQTVDFDSAEEQLKQAVLAAGGYFESQNHSSGGYYNSGALRRGEYVARIPAEKYRSFVDGMSGFATVTSLQENVEDVGLSYCETEARLKTLYTKEERLQELLGKASGLSDIIALENELSNTEYQIDMYRSELNRYDSLISYSTVTVSLQEVNRPDEGIGENPGFFANLGKRFVTGLENVLTDLEHFAYWVSENFIPLALGAGVIVFISRKHPVKKIRQKISARREAKKAEKKDS